MTTSSAAMRHIEQLLSDTLGFDVASIGQTAIDRAVRHRMLQLGVAHVDEYVQQVPNDPRELQALIEQVVVPETWFLRNPEAFDVMRDAIIRKDIPTQSDGILRVLSIPCSTGEEAYSIAITLAELGLPPERTRIDAIDISMKALAFATRGIYTANSFRGAAAYVREKYCDPTPDGRSALRESIRTRVRFEHGNVALPGFSPPAALYDVVFCRNLLIYFDRAAQKQAFATISERLT